MASLRIISAGPALSIQDLGRSGWHAYGLSRGGAVDRTALYEAGALLSQSATLSAIEMPLFGGEFLVSGDCRIALTGAPMIAHVNDTPLIWNASHTIFNGQKLTIGAAQYGVYGYLSVAGGFDTDPVLGSRSSHLAAGIGELLQTGDVLPIGADANPGCSPAYLPDAARFNGGEIRVVPTLHTSLYSESVITRFENTTFHSSSRRNRQGMALDFDGTAFTMDAQHTVLSEPAFAGDIQMTGEGLPFVLQSECQSIGGFARIAQVLPCDLPTVTQATPDKPLRFKFITLQEADLIQESFDDTLCALIKKVKPLTRDASEISDLLSYQLISGASNALD